MLRRRQRLGVPEVLLHRRRPAARRGIDLRFRCRPRQLEERLPPERRAERGGGVRHAEVRDVRRIAERSADRRRPGRTGELGQQRGEAAPRGVRRLDQQPTSPYERAEQVGHRTERDPLPARRTVEHVRQGFRGVVQADQHAARRRRQVGERGAVPVAPDPDHQCPGRGAGHLHVEPERTRGTTGRAFAAGRPAAGTPAARVVS